MSDKGDIGMTEDIFDKLRTIMEGKSYKVNGELLELIHELIGMYKEPCIIYNKDKIDYIPFPERRRDFLIGRIAEMFEKSIQEIEE